MFKNIQTNLAAIERIMTMDLDAGTKLKLIGGTSLTTACTSASRCQERPSTQVERAAQRGIV